MDQKGRVCQETILFLAMARLVADVEAALNQLPGASLMPVAGRTSVLDRQVEALAPLPAAAADGNGGWL